MSIQAGADHLRLLLGSLAQLMSGPTFDWHQSYALPSLGYQCGHCGYVVAVDTGYIAMKVGFRSSMPAAMENVVRAVYICSHCKEISYLKADGELWPRPLPGKQIAGLPGSVESIFREAKQCFQAGAFTACLMVLRTLIAHVAVEKGSAERATFKQHIEFLETSGLLPPDMGKMLHVIREQGNEVTHEIQIANQEQARLLLEFTSMTLWVLYEIKHTLDSLLD